MHACTIKKPHVVAVGLDDYWRNWAERQFIGLFGTRRNIDLRNHSKGWYLRWSCICCSADPRCGINKFNKASSFYSQVKTYLLIKKVKVTGFTILEFKNIRNLVPLTAPGSILTVCLTPQMVSPPCKPSTDSDRELNNAVGLGRLLQQWRRRKIFPQEFWQEAVAKGPGILQGTLCFTQKTWKCWYFHFCKSEFWSYPSP